MTEYRHAWHAYCSKGIMDTLYFSSSERGRWLYQRIQQSGRALIDDVDAAGGNQDCSTDEGGSTLYDKSDHNSVGWLDSSMQGTTMKQFDFTPDPKVLIALT
ncbi:MAG: hypothetical protein Q4D06_02505, partial [Coriobacteriia bacterium]|nr:hypothetical protein [Coriobacteriia bacterium]